MRNLQKRHCVVAKDELFRLDNKKIREDPRYLRSIKMILFEWNYLFLVCVLLQVKK